MSERFRSLAATLRVANVPSVISNVTLGMALAAIGSPPSSSVLALSLTITCAIGLYLSGNVFNDWHDREWDATHRPERALPLKQFLPSHYLMLGITLMLASWTCAALASTQALIVSLITSLAILVYTWTHKQSTWSVIPMALCRALLPILGFVAYSASWPLQPSVITAATGLFAYLIALCLSARNESKSANKQSQSPWSWIYFLPVVISMPVALWLAMPLPYWAPFLGLTPFLIWVTLCLTHYKTPIPVHVSALLAGIPLVDAIVLLPAGLLISEPKSLMIACLAIPPLAFTGGKALQRLAPAT